MTVEQAVPVVCCAAFDADGKEVGAFENISLGAAASLDLAAAELHD